MIQNTHTRVSLLLLNVGRCSYQHTYELLNVILAVCPIHYTFVHVLV
jgi:hypothetical protein